MTDSYAPTHHRGVTQRLTAAQQHWSRRVMVIWTWSVNWRGLCRPFKLPVCYHQHKYELNPICYFSFFFSCLCFTCSLSSVEGANHCFVFFDKLYELLWISSTKPSLLCTESYICKWICMFWYCIPSMGVKSMALGFIASDQVNSLTWFCPEASAGSAVDELGRGRHQGKQN